MAFMYYGKKYDTKAELRAAQKKAVSTKGKKKGGSFFEKFIEGSKSKKAKAEKASIASGKANKAATKKMYAAESMFKSAKDRDDAKVKPGKARSFKDAFDAATKADKSKFMHKGKSYLTTKGKREDRFNPTKIKAADKKLNLFQKFTKKMRGTNPDGSIRTQKEYEAAREKRRNKK